MPELTADEIHVLLDVITTRGVLSTRPWEQYEGDPANDPKLTEAGWSTLLRNATEKLTEMLNVL
jgi:hypothetical protein